MAMRLSSDGGPFFSWIWRGLRQADASVPEEMYNRKNKAVAT